MQTKKDTDKERYRQREILGQIDKKTERQIDIQTVRQIDSETDRQ